MKKLIAGIVCALIAAGALATTAPAYAAISLSTKSAVNAQNTALLAQTLNVLEEVLGNMRQMIHAKDLSTETKNQLITSLAGIKQNLSQIQAAVPSTRQLAMVSAEKPETRVTAPKSASTPAPALPKPLATQSKLAPMMSDALPRSSAPIENRQDTRETIPLSENPIQQTAPIQNDQYVDISALANANTGGFNAKNLLWPIVVLALIFSVLFFLRSKEKNEQVVEYVSVNSGDADLHQKSAP